VLPEGWQAKIQITRYPNPVKPSYQYQNVNVTLKISKEIQYTVKMYFATYEHVFYAHNYMLHACLTTFFCT